MAMTTTSSRDPLETVEPPLFEALSENLFIFRDTCNVYVVRSGREAILIDFGAGDVLDHLDAFGVEHVSDILMTHHHRDQAQGLDRAVEAGIRIWVPHTEQEFFHSADAHWQARELFNNYNPRQDRFSLLQSVPVSGTLKDYETWVMNQSAFQVVPTPGHTIGSISLLATVDGQRVAFTGDLITGPGQVWSLAATQWTYNGAEGVAFSLGSLLDLQSRDPDLLLPSHGEPMPDPDEAINLTVERLGRLLQLRGDNPRLYELRAKPYEAITPHLLFNRTSMANSYVLLSDSGKALMLDFGYDFTLGVPLGSDRASRRPWLYTIPALKHQFGVEKIDVVIPTHFHDDHVAGIELLHRVEGAQVWVADFITDVLRRPQRYDLPCLWYDPVPVDRQLPLDTDIQWEEYTLRLYALPGHTFYAVAIGFEVDGYKVLVTGDQYQGNDGLKVNYVYPNRFHADDYIKSAQLYRRVRPDLILTGHWQPQWVTPNYFDKLDTLGADLARLHHELQPGVQDWRQEGFVARISPYQSTAGQGQEIELQVEISNPFAGDATASLRMVVPLNWKILDAVIGDERHSFNEAGIINVPVPANGIQCLDVHLRTATTFVDRRARVAVDVTIGSHRFGQQAEALISAV